jgi:hypothetical protein
VASRRRNLVVAAGLKTADGLAVQTAWTPPSDFAPGEYEAVFTQDRVVLEAGTYSVLIGLSDGDRGLQQFEAARVDLVGENAVGYYPATSGMGAVLNSMKVEIRAS